jgi:Fe-S-cluster-containing hydrogenase component 2
MLKDILISKKCFKLICGAGNQNLDEIANLVAIYAKAGCRFFDFAADIDVLQAAKLGLSRAGVEESSVHFCVSIGTSSDKHLQKASVDLSKCVYCKKCKNICPQDAIYCISTGCVVDITKCIGCGKCSKVCPASAIDFSSEEQNFLNLLPPLISSGIDCIEFHLNGDEGDEIYEKWNELNNCYDGILSICIGRKKVSDEKMLEILSNLLSSRKPYTTIIQADGVSMSGDIDDYSATLPAVSTAEVIQKASLPAFLIISGGTNSKSTELAKQCNVKLDGVAMGSFARKIVKGLDFDSAVVAAKKLIDVSLAYLA